MEMQDTLIVVSLTQTEINAIPTPETAGIVYNSTTSTVQFYDGAAWVNGSGEYNTASNVGAGAEIWKAKVGDDLEFRSLIGGTNVTLVPGTDDITINASGGSGDLLSTNNLSDVTNAVTSLGNLGGEPAFAKNTGFNKDFGTIAGTVLEGNTTTITGAESTKLAFVTVTQAVDLDTIETDVATNNAKNSYPSGDATKVGHLTVTQAVDLDTLESDVAANNAKVTNATHTGEVTGNGALTVGPTAISNKASVTAAAGMEVLVNDAGTLKKADASDFLGGGTYFKTQIIMPSAPVAISGSASNQAVTGLSYTIVTAGDYVFYAMVTADIAGSDAKPFSVTIYKNGVEETNSRFGDFAKKNEAQSIATTYPISGLVATDVIAVYIDNDNIDCDILLGRLFVQSWG